jgi:hypothetical protein
LIISFSKIPRSLSISFSIPIKSFSIISNIPSSGGTMSIVELLPGSIGSIKSSGTIGFSLTFKIIFPSAAS